MTDQYEWPTEPGTYPLATTEGYEDEWQLGFDGKWTCGEVKTRPFSTSEMKSDGYLGVRIPQDSVEKPSIATEAMAAYRKCRQQPHFSDWAMKYGPVLCRELGAE